MRLPLVVALTLLLAAPAMGKGVVDARACGVDGCVDISALGHGVIGGMTGSAPDKAQPFIEVRAGIGEPRKQKVFERITLQFLPEAGLLYAQDGSWFVPDPAAADGLRAAAAKVELFPAAKLLEVAPELAPPPAPQAAPAADRPAPPPADRGAAGGGGPSALLLAGLAAAALAAVAAVAVARRRPAAAP